MITTAIVAFREFIEAFLIVGVFLGISKKLKLRKEKEVWLAVSVGVVLSLILAIATYFFGDSIRNFFTEKNTEILEGSLMIFSGLFIAYVIFSLHDILQKNRQEDVIKSNDKLKNNIFDLSLFFTVMLLVLREGFEIALFTASFSLLSTFMDNFVGLMIGFLLSIIFGLVILFIYKKLPIAKIFKATEYMIILLGAALFQRGVTKFAEIFVHIDLSQIFSFHLTFLPHKDTLTGHLIKGFFGIDKNFSLAKLIVMLVYFILIYFMFLKKK